ncbi:VTC domain-containing protein [Globicatella sanguinis]
MKPFKTKFKRIETKFILSQAQLNQLQPILDLYMEPNEFAHSTIANLYYDTEDYRMIRQSLEKPKYKEKIRVRSYSALPNNDSQVFAEIKKKFQKVVYKRRLGAPLDETMAFFNGQSEAIDTSQVKEELVYLQRQYQRLKPKMYIYYDRYSLQGKEDKDMRITFDRNITYRDYDLDLTYGPYGEQLLPEGYCLMEVKIEGAYPLWLIQELTRLKVYQSSFSKYGCAYQAVKQQGGNQYGQFVS